MTSDLCQGILRVSSEDSSNIFYDVVPENQEYLIKLLSKGEILVNFKHVLKKGRSLPYSLVLLGT